MVRKRHSGPRTHANGDTLGDRKPLWFIHMSDVYDLELVVHGDAAAHQLHSTLLFTALPHHGYVHNITTPGPDPRQGHCAGTDMVILQHILIKKIQGQCVLIDHTEPECFIPDCMHTNTHLQGLVLSPFLDRVPVT